MRACYNCKVDVNDDHFEEEVCRVRLVQALRAQIKILETRTYVLETQLKTIRATVIKNTNGQARNAAAS